jgi:cyclopropane-fatty-acyl-phospholipid synthase
MARLTAPLHRLVHALRPNTRSGSRKNIAAHYDLGNDFFELWLDETMTYSSGLFERADATLAEASTAKLDRLCRKLDLQPGDRLLEIGCGWGSMALHAAGRYGVHVTATTISDEQYALAAERVARAGLGDKVTLIKEDYRDLQGTWDKLVSVEMIEAVGASHLDTYLRACSRLLEPDGLFALQAITIADQHYERARDSVDFIKRHIFPGSFIPCVTAIVSSATNTGDMRLVNQEDMGPHYARTLAAWRENLRDRWDDARSRGYGDDFLRLWDYYLAYCEGGFAERFLGVSQMLFAKPGNRRESVLP